MMITNFINQNCSYKRDIFFTFDIYNFYLLILAVVQNILEQLHLFKKQGSLNPAM